MKNITQIIDTKLARIRQLQEQAQLEQLVIKNKILDLEEKALLLEEKVRVVETEYHEMVEQSGGKR